LKCRQGVINGDVNKRLWFVRLRVKP
jgi:hypothetical protein